MHRTTFQDDALDPHGPLSSPLSFDKHGKYAWSRKPKSPSPHLFLILLVREE